MAGLPIIFPFFSDAEDATISAEGDSFIVSESPADLTPFVFIAIYDGVIHLEERAIPWNACVASTGPDGGTTASPKRHFY